MRSIQKTYWAASERHPVCSRSGRDVQMQRAVGRLGIRATHATNLGPQAPREPIMLPENYRPPDWSKIESEALPTTRNERNTIVPGSFFSRKSPPVPILG